MIRCPLVVPLTTLALHAKEPVVLQFAVTCDEFMTVFERYDLRGHGAVLQLLS